MLPDGAPAGRRSDTSRADTSRQPPSLPVFPAAPTPMRARRPATAAHVPVESDVTEDDKYGEHVTPPPPPPAPTNLVATAGGNGLDTVAASAPVAIAVSSAPHLRVGGSASRQAAIARTRRWALRIVFTLVVVWFLLMRFAVWDEDTVAAKTATTAVPIVHRETSTTRTTDFFAPPLTPLTGTKTQKTVERVSTTLSVAGPEASTAPPISPTRPPLSDVSTSPVAATGHGNPLISELHDQQAREQKAAADPATSEAHAQQPSARTASAIKSDEEPHSPELSRTPLKSEDGESLVTPFASAESTVAVTSLQLPMLNTDAETTTAARPRTTKGTFTVVTVVVVAEDLVQLTSPSTSSLAKAAPARYAPSESLSARRFAHLARGLYSSGLTQHPLFYEWLVYRPAHVNPSEATREREAVREWWCDEARREQRASAENLLKDADGDATLIASPGCRHRAATVLEDVTDSAACTVDAAVRVVPSRRPRNTKPAALWMEAVISVQTSFLILHELHWTVRLPAPTATAFLPSAMVNVSGVPPALTRWYALGHPQSVHTTVHSERRHSDRNDTETAECPVLPLTPLHTLRKSYMTHLLDVGVQMLSGSKDDGDARVARGVDGERVAPPVVVEFGNFRDAQERGVHAYRLQYYASEFDVGAASREREGVLTKQLQMFLGLVATGKANMGRHDARANGSATDMRRKVVDGLPTAMYGTDQLYHCHRAPLYDVQVPVPAYMRGGAQAQRRAGTSGEDHNRTVTTSPAHTAKTETVSLCDLLVNRRHHGYMRNYTADPFSFHWAYCEMWSTLVGPEQTWLVGQHALQTCNTTEEDGRSQHMAKARARLLKSNRLAEGVCTYEWVRVLKEEQEKAKKRRPRKRAQLSQLQQEYGQRQERVRQQEHEQQQQEEKNRRPHGRPKTSARGGQLLAMASEDEDAQSPLTKLSFTDVTRVTGDTHSDADLVDDDVRGGTPLRKFARMLYSENETVRLFLAHHFLAHTDPNMSHTLEVVQARVSAKLDKMTASYVVADGKRRRKQQQYGDLEVVCLPSRTAVFSMAPTLYDTKWLTDNVAFKCQKRLRDCVGTRGEDDTRSMQTMQTFLTGAVQWSQGAFQVCTVPGPMVEDTAAGLLAHQDEAQRV